MNNAAFLHGVCAGLLLIIAACGDTSAEGRSQTPPAKSATMKLPQTWSGLILQSRKLYPATLSIYVDDGDVTGALLIEQQNGAGQGLIAADGEIAVTGAYDPEIGVLSLATQSGDRRGELIFDIAVSDVGSVAVASEQMRQTKGRGSQRARAAFAADKNGMAALARIAELAAAFEGWRPEMAEGDCPKALAAWRDETLAFQQTRRDPVEQFDVFYTDAFRKAFGGPYQSVSPDNIKANASLLRGACRPEDRVLGNKTNQLAYMVGQGEPHQQHLLWKFESAAAARWVEMRAKTLKSDAQMTRNQLNLLDTMWRGIGIGRYGFNISELNADIENRKNALRAKENREEMLAFYDRYRDRFDLLVEIARNHAHEDAAFLSDVQKKLDDYLEPASVIYARDADNVSEADFMLAWSH
ncbi:MAG: hypothetical protein R3C51_11875 [Parvularculaceae bacterium]